MAYIPLSRRIVIRQSTTANEIPSSAELNTGEIGINAADGKLYVRDTAGNVTLPPADVIGDLGYTPLNRAGDTMTGALVLNANPTTALQAATKQYVDSLAEGFQVKAAARVATTTNLVGDYNNGAAGVGATITANPAAVLPTVDGITLSVGNRILVKNQTNAAHNGIYIVTQTTSPWILTRCGGCDEATEIPSAYVFVQQGTQQGSAWSALVGDPGSFVVGTTNIVWTQVGTAGSYTAGTGISIVGQLISIADNATFPGTSHVTLPSGTTGNRTGSPSNGMIRYNTTLNKFEGYEAGAWTTMIGNATPGGSNTQIQYNNAGAFAGSAEFTWNNTNRTLSVGVSGAGVIRGNSGGLTIQSAGSASTGDLSLQASAGLNQGNSVLISAGSGANTNSGGNVTITAGTGGVTTGFGGNVSISGGLGGGGGPGGLIVFNTAPTGTLVERFRIINNGAWGLAGANYGTTGQVLTSNGSGSAPTWQTVSSGFTGGTVANATTFQSQVTSTAPASTSVANFYCNSSSRNWIAFNTNGVAAPAALSDAGTGAGRSAGTKLMLYPATVNGNAEFAIGIEAGFMWYSTDTTTSGHKWYTSTTERLRIAGNGAWGLAGANFGTTGQVLTSNGSGAAPTWQSAGGGTLTSTQVGFGNVSNVLSGSTDFTFITGSNRLQLGSMSGSPTGIISGADTASGNAGLIIVRGGDITGGGGNGGAATLRGGNAFGGLGGAVSILAGTSTGSQGSGITITASNSGSGGDAPGGSITLTAGNASNAGTGGSITLTAGTSPSGTPGSISLASRTDFGSRYTELRNNVTAATSTTINAALGNQFVVTMSANITTLAFSNVPASTRVYTMTLFLVQDATGGRTITWPVSVKWPGGVTPTLTAAGTKTDIVTLTTYDGGTTWLGLPVAFNL